MTQPAEMRLLVLISGSGSNLQAIIDQCASGGLGAQIVAVISNRADAFGLERAQKAGIATQVLDHREYPDRESYDRQLAQLVESFRPEVIALAGFMRILSPFFVQRFSGRMFNIHPSLLPKFTGLHTHQRALEAGETRHGASVHFVTAELDGGPVVLQSWVAVEPGDDPASLGARVLRREHLIYPTVLRWFAEGRLRLEGDEVICNAHPLEVPILLGPDEAPPF